MKTFTNAIPKIIIPLIVLMIPMLVVAQHKKEYISFQTGQVLKASADESGFKFDLKKEDDNSYLCQLQGSLIYSIDVNSTLYHQLYIEGLSPFGEEGMPALPAKNILIDIDQKQKPKIEITALDTLTINQINIIPNTPAEKDLTLALSEISLPDQYAKDTFYPEKWVEVVDVQISKGQSIAIVQVHPIRFNPVTKQIMVARNLHFKLETSSLKKKSIGLGAGSNYLILTPEVFGDAAKQFAAWKNKTGYNTQVISAERWTSQLIKESISEAYQSNSESLDYLLLIGDHELMPAEEFYREDDDEMKLFVSDLYYACMDGEDDYMPDMAYGRLPVSSEQEAQQLVNKLIKYMASPPKDSDYYNTVVGCAQYQDDDLDGYADRRFTQTSEDVGDYLKEKEYDYKRIYMADEDVTPKYYNDGKYSSGGDIPSELLRKNGFKWDGDAAQIVEAINQGTFFTFHRDHGMTSGLGWSHPEFTVEHFSEFDNINEPTILYSINCHSGKFNIPESFAEAMVLSPQGGAIAAFCATNTSYSGYNDAMFVAMVDAIWNDPGIVPDLGEDNYTKIKEHDRITALGDILNYGKIRMLNQWTGNADTHQHIFELFHLLGDPSMLMPIEQPLQMEITCPDWYSDTELSITSGNIQNAKLTLSDDSDKRLFSGFISNGTATIAMSEVDADSVELVVSSEGYMPFIKWIRKDKPLLSFQDTIRLETLDLGELPFEHSIKLTNVGRGDFTIHSILSDNSDFDFTLPDDKIISENTSWGFDLQINSASIGKHKDIIIINTVQESFTIVVEYLVATKTVGEEFEGLLIKANSPYYIASDLSIPLGSEVIIEAGVEIIFDDGIQLTINGSIEANGTEQDPIVFSGLDSHTWKGIKLLSNSEKTSIFEYCKFGQVQNDDIGGAVYIDGYEDVKFFNCWFNNNSSKKGGAAYVTNSEAVFNNCTFQNNSADYGGALYLLEADAKISNCIFSENKSVLYGGSGGAMYCKTSNPLIEGSLFYNNYAAFAGAIYLRDNSEGLLVNNTFTKNLSNYGAGIRFKTESHTNIYNSIFWDNEAFSGGKEIYCYEDCEPRFTNCIIKGGQDKIRVYKDKLFNGVLKDCVEDNPELLDNCKIDANSNAKDTGLETISNYVSPQNDLQGGERFRYETIDIGAYEFQNYVPTGLELSCDSVLRGLEEGICIGLLATEDLDEDDEHSYQILNDNIKDFFTIRHDSVYTTKALSGLSGDEIQMDIEVQDNGFGKLAYHETFNISLSDYHTALIKTLSPISTYNYPLDTIVKLDEYFMMDKKDAVLQFELGATSDPLVAKASLNNNELKISYLDLGAAYFDLKITNGTEVINQQLAVLVQGPTAIGDMETQQLMVYPNPCKDEIWIRSDAASQLNEKTKVEVYNLQGQLHHAEMLKNRDGYACRINMAGLSSGVYVVKIIQNQKLSYQQLIVKK